LDKVKADRSLIEELKRKSGVERKRREDAARKLREETQEKKRLKLNEEATKRQKEIDKQKRLSKVSAELIVSLKKVVDHLTEVKETVLFEDVYKRLCLKGGKSKLWDLLKKNRFVECGENPTDRRKNTIRYKSKYAIRNKIELVRFLYTLWRKPVEELTRPGHPSSSSSSEGERAKDAKEKAGSSHSAGVNGAAFEDVVECYRGAREDVDALVAAGTVFAVQNSKTHTKVLFCPDNPDQAKVRAPDQGLVQLWHTIGGLGNTAEDPAGRGNASGGSGGGKASAASAAAPGLGERKPPVQVALRPVSDAEVDGALRDCGIAPARRVFKWKKLAEEQKRLQKERKLKGRANKRMHNSFRQKTITNAHMPELFQNKQPESFS